VSDAELLRRAIDASGIVDPRTGLPSVRGFARHVLALDEGSARDVLAGTRRLTPDLRRVVCAEIIDDPPLALRLAARLDALRATTAA
jgi:hypothetical protein